MACDTWEDVAGYKCNGCGGYATHFYGSYGAICCDCHGGCLVSQKDAKTEHERVIFERNDKGHKKIIEDNQKEKEIKDVFSGK